MKMTGKQIQQIVVLSTIALIALAASSCKRGNSNWDASGVFEATEVIISSEVNGKIERFGVLEGDKLVKGEEIGYIDTTQLYLQKMQLIASNKATLSQRVSVPKQIASIKEQIATQKREKARFEALVASNAANQKQVDDIESSIKVLESQLDAQTEILEQTNKGVTDQSSSIEIQIAQIEDLIEKSIIESPLDGVVLSKYAEEGELAAQGRALFKIADISKLYLRAYITADQLTRCKLGDEVKVYADWGNSDSKEYQGEITWISDQAEFTPKTIQTRNERTNLVYAIKILVHNDGFIKRGMYGEVEFLN